LDGCQIKKVFESDDVLQYDQNKANQSLYFANQSKGSKIKLKKN